MRYSPKRMVGSFTVSTFLVILLLSELNTCQGSLAIQLNIDDATVNADAIYSFQLFLTDMEILSGTQFEIKVPALVTANYAHGDTLDVCEYTTTVGVTVSAPVAGTCTYSLIPPDKYVYFTLDTTFTSTNQFTLYIGNLQNPGSTVLTDSFQVVLTGGDTGSQSSGLIRTYNPGAITEASVAADSNPLTQAGASDTYLFIFKIANDIPSGGSVIITFPSADFDGAPSLSTSDIEVTKYGTDVSGVIPSLKSTYEIELSGIFTTTLTADPTKFLAISLSGVTNPNTVGLTDSFQILTTDSGGYSIDQVTTGLQVDITLVGSLEINSFFQSSLEVDVENGLSFDLESSVQYNSGGYIEVVAPSPYITETSSTLFCVTAMGFDSGASCSRPDNDYTVRFYADLNPFSTQQFFMINSFVNTLGATTLPSFEVYYKNSDGDTVASVTDGLSYTTTSGSCSIVTAERDVGSSLTVAENTALYTMTFRCDHRILSTGYIRFFFPVGQMGFNSGMTCSEIGNPGNDYNCNIQLINSNTQVRVIIAMADWEGSDVSALALLSIQFNDVANPGYIQSSPDSFEIYTRNEDYSPAIIIDEVTSGLTFTGDLLPGVITVTSLSRTSSGLTGSVPTYTFDFTITTDIPAGGIVEVDFPSLTAYDSGSISCQVGSSSTACSYTLSGSSDRINKVSFTNICSSGCSGGDSFSIEITDILNPFSTRVPTSDTFTISSYTSEGYLIDEGSADMSPSLSLSPNTLTFSIIDPASGSLVGAIDTFVFSVTMDNNPFPGSDGSVIITIPAQMEVQSGATCTAVKSSTTLTCDISSSTNQITVTSSTEFNAGSTFKITVPEGIMNPGSTKPTDAFIVETFNQDIYEIDYDNSVTFTCDTPNEIFNAVASRDQTDVSVLTDITLCFETTNPIPSDGTIMVIIHNNQLTYNSAISVTDGNPVVSDDLAFATQKSMFELTVWCSGTSCDPGNTHCTTITGYENPASAIVSTNSLQIRVMTSDGYMVDRIKTGLLITPYVREGPLQSMAVTRTNDIVGQNPTYEIEFQLAADGELETDGTTSKLLIVFPVELLFLKSDTDVPDCAVMRTDTIYRSVDCDVTDTNNHDLGKYIVSVEMDLDCSHNAVDCSNGATLTVMLSGTTIFNPYDTDPISGATFSIATLYESGGETIVKNSLDMAISSTDAIAQFETDDFTSISITRDETTVDSDIELEIICTTPHRLIAGGYIQVRIPATQAVPNGQTYKYRHQSSATGSSLVSAIQATVISETDSVTILQMEEWCSGLSGSADYCDDDFTLQFIFTKGFKNPRSTATPTSFFYILTMSSDFHDAVKTNSLSATPSVETAALTVSSVSFSSQLVAKTGMKMTITMEFGASVESTDYMEIAFDDEFVRNDAGAIDTCEEGSGAHSPSCSGDSGGDNIIDLITVTDICASTCTSTFSYELKVSGLVNLLEQKTFSGTMTVTIYTSSADTIAVGTFDLSTMSTLDPNKLTASVTRTVEFQGTDSDFDITFATPSSSILLAGTTIKIQLPFEQILEASTYSATEDGGSTLTLTLDTTTADYEEYSFTSPNCPSSDCSGSVSETVTITNSKNPFIQSTGSLQDFVISYYSPSGNLVFQSESPLEATPTLTYGEISVTRITHQISSYVNEKTGYKFKFDTQSTIPANGRIKFVFPKFRAYETASFPDLECTDSSITYDASSSFSANRLTITLTDPCPTSCSAGTFTITCSGGVVNPPSVKDLTEDFTIRTTDSSNNIIDEGTEPVDDVGAILPAIISATVTRQSILLSIATTYTVQVTTVNDIPADGYIRIVIPLDQVTVSAFGPTCTDGLLAPLTCQMVYSDETQMYVDIENSFCAAECIPQTLDVILGDTTNPTLFTANEVTSTWQIYTMNSDKEYIDGIDSGVEATPELTGKNVIVLDAELEDPIVYTSTYFKIKLQTGNYFDNSAIFDIYFPDELFYYDQKTQCFQILSSTIGFYCDFTYFDSGYIEKVTLYNPCPFECQASTSYIYQIPVLTRGDTYQVGGEFEVITRNPSTDIGQGYLSNSLFLEAANITEYYFQNDGCDTVSERCSLTIYFSQLNHIPNEAANGRIYIQYPEQIWMQSRYCSMRIHDNSYGSSCKIDTFTRTIIATHQYSYASLMQNRNVSIKINDMLNPDSTAPTDPFIFRTQAGYDSGSSIVYYDIDVNTTGIFYQVNKTSSFESVQIIREPMLDGNGYLTGQPTALTFLVQLHHELTSQAQFKFQLPENAQVMFLPVVTGYTCYSLNKDLETQSVLLCSYEPENGTISIQNLCFIQSCGQKDTIRFRVFDDFIQNYYYVVSPFNVSKHSMKLWSTTYDGYYFVDGQEEDLWVTPELEPSPLIMPTPEVIRTGNVVLQNVEWIINFKINKSPIPSQGYIVIKIPPGLLFARPNYTLSVQDQDSGQEYPESRFWYSSDGSANRLKIENFCNYVDGVYEERNCTIGSAYSLNILNVQNPPSQINITKNIVIKTYTNQSYLIERGETPAIIDLLSQLIPLRISKVETIPVNPIPAVTTDYQIYIHNKDVPLAPDDYIIFTFPQEVTLLEEETSARRLNEDARCQNIFEPELELFCEVVGDNQLKVEGVFKSEIQHFGVYVKNLKNPVSNMTTSPLQMFVYNADGYSVASRTTQTRIIIYPILEENATCSQICKTCAGSNSTCTSCNVPSAYPILKDYTCIDSCGWGYYFDEERLKCYKCHESCSSCYGPGFNKCFGCSGEYLFQNGECVLNCDSGFLENSQTGECQSPASACDSKCKTCSSDPEYCLSCDLGSQHPVFDPIKGRCLENNQTFCNGMDSDKYFINETTMQCERCEEVCGSCVGTAETCMTCTTYFSKNMINDLYQTCVDSCGLGTFYNNETNVCSWCNPICMLCEGHGPDQCLVCNSTPAGRELYFHQNQCVLTCPEAYEADLQTKTCVALEINYMSFSAFFIAGSAGLAIFLVMVSTLFSCFRNSFIDILYSFLSIIECLNRVLLLGNLWIGGSVFTLAVCFMNIIGTITIGVFFNFLFMSPIYAYSPHFRTLRKDHACAYQTATFWSYIGGVNVMRLLTSKFMGLNAFSSDLKEYKFYFSPLNTMANFTLIFSASQAALCGYTIWTTTIYEEIYWLSGYGGVLNVIFMLLQMVKHFMVMAKLHRFKKPAQSKPR